MKTASVRENHQYEPCLDPTLNKSIFLSIVHFFLFCPRYAAQRNVLFASAATILGETWSSSSDARKIHILLYGVKSVNYDITVLYFVKSSVL